MFDIGLPELLLIALISLFVLGPKRIPEIVKNFMKFSRWMRNLTINAKNEIEQHIGLEEIRQDIHNEEVLKSEIANKENIEVSIIKSKIV